MKSLIIAKSNLRKFKGLSICISILILITSMFITALFLLQTDFSKNIENNSKALNTSDAVLFSKDDLTEAEIVSILDENIIEYKYQRSIITSISSKYGSGVNSNNVYMENSSAFDREMSKVEIIEENKDINLNYIYLPYQYHTGGDINLNEDYEMKVKNNTYVAKVKGFINSTFGGCNNMGKVEIILSDELYEEVISENPDMETFMLYINYNDSNNIDEKVNRFIRDTRLNYGYELDYSTNQLIIENRGFMSDIFFVMFFMVALVIIAITLLSIFNNISNYLRENLKTLGILKATGYTSNDIRKAILLQFTIIMSLGIILGIGFGYIFVQALSGVLVAQSGLPYTVSFSFISTIAPIVIVPIFIYLIIFIAMIKVRKIEPVNAIREETNGNKAKKNYFSLEKTKHSINVRIALKNMMNALKQNIMSFIVLIFVSLSLVTAVTFYENFDRTPKTEMFTLELFDGGIVVDNAYKDEVYNYISSDSRTRNVREVYDGHIMDQNFKSLYVVAVDNVNNYNNKNVCYKGSLPYNDNEVMISGSYAKSKGLNIGDKLYLSGVREYDFTVSGLGLTAITGQLGLNLLIIRAVYPELVGSIIAQHLSFNAELVTFCAMIPVISVVLLSFK